MSQDLSEYQLKALSYYFEYSIERNINLNFDRFIKVITIDNDFALNALKYSSLDIAYKINNQHQLDVLRYYDSQKNLEINSNNSEHLFDIENHCQSSAIELGLPLKLAASFKECAYLADYYDDVL